MIGSRFKTLPSSLPYFHTRFWLVIAAVTGMLIAQQPFLAVLAAVAVAAVIAATVTPLAALAAMLILAPLRTLIATESALHLPLDIGQWTLFTTLLFWFFFRLRQRTTPVTFQWSPVFVPTIVFTALAGLTAFSALSLGAWLSEWLKWVQILILMFLVQQLGRARRWEWMAFGLALSGMANALIGIYEFFGGSGALHLVVNNRYFRAFGTFGQPNPFGGFMGLIAPLAIALTVGYSYRLFLRWRQTREIRLSDAGATLFYLTASVTIAVALLMSWSRGAWLGFGAAIVAVVFAYPRKLRHSLALVAIVLTVLGVLWSAGRLPASIAERVNSATQELFAFDDVRGVDITPENYAVVERLAHWQAALNMARANPVLGIGMGNYEVAYPEYRLINWKFPLGHAHNYYLNVFAEAGIMGLISYIALWVSVILLTWRARQNLNILSRFAVLGLMGTWTYLTVHSLTDNLYVNNLFLHLGVMLGLLAVLANLRESSVQLRMG